jgi:hypothetical protein
VVDLNSATPHILNIAIKTLATTTVQQEEDGKTTTAIVVVKVVVDVDQVVVVADATTITAILKKGTSLIHYKVNPVLSE